MVCTSHLCGQTLVLNEVQNSNTYTVADEDDDFEDWVELLNIGLEAIQLEGYGLSDNSSNAYKWVFPDVEILPGQYMVIWLSGKDRNDPTMPLHTNFSLSAEEPLLFFSPDTFMVDMFLPLDLPADVSYGRTEDGTVGDAYFAEPTPGAPNITEPFAGIAPKPTFSHPSGYYSAGFDLTISSPLSTDDILYTLDGSDPLPARVDNPEAYSYKQSFPQMPGDPFGDFHFDTLFTYAYTDPIPVVNRTDEPDRISQKSSTYDLEPDYFPVVSSFKGTVVRAVNVREGWIPSSAVSGIYFVSPEGADRYNIPVVSLITSENNLFEYNSGIATAGNRFDTFRTLYPDMPPFPASIALANFLIRGSAWERPVRFDYFMPGQPESVYGSDMGLRIHGSSSRRFPRKSFRLYSRSSYGMSALEYPFFDNHFTQTFRKLVLKNGGGDISFANMRDVVAHSIGSPLDAFTTSSSPSFVFLNGEFYGLHSMQEFIDDEYLHIRQDIEKENLEIYKKTNLKHGSSDRHEEINAFLMNHTLTDDENFAQFADWVDVNSMRDVFILNLFSGNQDWFPKNTLMWRSTVADELNDTKFHYAVIDLDKAFAHPQSGPLDYQLQFDLYSFLVESDSAIRPADLQWFLSAIQNDGFARSFLNRFADAMNSYFMPDRCVEIVDGFAQAYAPHYQEQVDRWQGLFNASSVEAWHSDVHLIRDFLMQRHPYVRQHLIENFELAGNVKVVMDVSNPNHGHVVVNTIEISESTPGIPSDPYPWQGLYFKGVAMDFIAIPQEGYAFSHWEGTLGNPLDDTLGDTIDSTLAGIRKTFGTDSVYLKAVFLPKLVDGVDDLSHLSATASIHPNPVQEIFTLSLKPTANEIVHIEIRALDGRLLRRLPRRRLLADAMVEIKIPVFHLASGMYLCRVAGKHFNRTLPFVVE